MRPTPLSAVTLVVLLAACPAPTRDQVRTAFKAAHPACEVLSVEYPSEKDAPLNAYRVKYRCPGDAAVQVALWKYEPEKKAAPGSPKEAVESKPRQDSAKLPEAPRPTI